MRFPSLKGCGLLVETGMPHGHTHFDHKRRLRGGEIPLYVCCQGKGSTIGAKDVRAPTCVLLARWGRHGGSVLEVNLMESMYRMEVMVGFAEKPARNRRRSDGVSCEN